VHLKHGVKIRRKEVTSSTGQRRGHLKPTTRTSNQAFGTPIPTYQGGAAFYRDCFFAWPFGEAHTRFPADMRRSWLVSELGGKAKG